MSARGALLLDLDGTLVDSIPCWIEAYLETLQALGVPMQRETFVTSIYQRGASVATVLEELGLQVPEPAFRRRRERSKRRDRGAASPDCLPKGAPANHG